MSAMPEGKNAAPVAQPKKSGFWKWIAIGCLGIIVLTVGGCAILVKLGVATVKVNASTWEKDLEQWGKDMEKAGQEMTEKIAKEAERATKEKGEEPAKEQENK